jgi:hypothetical protein
MRVAYGVLVASLLATGFPIGAIAAGCKPADPGLAGHYYLRGVMEVGSELLLRRDGSFEYMLAYGALDEFASGCWTRNGATVTLRAQKFEDNMEDPAKGRPIAYLAAGADDVALRISNPGDYSIFILSAKLTPEVYFLNRADDIETIIDDQLSGFTYWLIEPKENAEFRKIARRLGITLADVRDALDRFSATVINHHTRLHRSSPSSSRKAFTSGTRT